MTVHKSPQQLSAENHSLRTEVAQLKQQRDDAIHALAQVAMGGVANCLSSRLWGKLNDQLVRVAKILEGK